MANQVPPVVAAAAAVFSDWTDDESPGQPTTEAGPQAMRTHAGAPQQVQAARPSAASILRCPCLPASRQRDARAPSPRPPVSRKPLDLQHSRSMGERVAARETGAKIAALEARLSTCQRALLHKEFELSKALKVAAAAEQRAAEQEHRARRRQQRLEDSNVSLQQDASSLAAAATAVAQSTLEVQQLRESNEELRQRLCQAAAAGKDGGRRLRELQANEAALKQELARLEAAAAAAKQANRELASRASEAEATVSWQDSLIQLMREGLQEAPPLARKSANPRLAGGRSQAPLAAAAPDSNLHLLLDGFRAMACRMAASSRQLRTELRQERQRADGLQAQLQAPKTGPTGPAVLTAPRAAASDYYGLPPLELDGWQAPFLTVRQLRERQLRPR